MCVCVCVCVCVWGRRRDDVGKRSRSQFMNWSHYEAFGFYPKVNGESFKDLTRRVTEADLSFRKNHSGNSIALQGKGPEALRPLGDGFPILSKHYCFFGSCKASNWRFCGKLSYSPLLKLSGMRLPE